MPARLPCAHHAFRAACEPAALATRPLAVSDTLAIRVQSQLKPPHHPSSPLSNHTLHQTRLSSSSTRWKTRQTSDPYTKSSKLTALKSRAAYKLLEINDKHKLFRAGQSVVDLGYAPGSWSQVAKNRVGESGRVVGIDVIPAQPPRGVSALQGDFLSEGVQELVRDFVREWKSGEAGALAREEAEDVRSVVERARGGGAVEAGQESVLVKAAEGEEGAEAAPATVEKKKTTSRKVKKLSPAALDLQQGRVVDVVLSDMMMNTSGNPFRDHAGSIDLCMAALTFCHDCLMTGGHFLCKFYQGPEDKDLENRMKKLFEKVHRIKPDSSRKESRESYFVGLRRKADVSKEDILG